MYMQYRTYFSLFTAVNNNLFTTVKDEEFPSPSFEFSSNVTKLSNNGINRSGQIALGNHLTSVCRRSFVKILSFSRHSYSCLTQLYT